MRKKKDDTRLVVHTGPQGMCLEGLTEWEMGLLYILAVEGNERILRNIDSYTFQDPQRVRGALEKIQRTLHAWVGTLPDGSPVRKELFR